MNLLVVDCYDSFTYNLIHYLEQMSSNVVCTRNDKIDISSLNDFDGIVLSPGPGLPEETKNLYEIIKVWGSTKPILGICLGHQAIGTYYGLKLVNMDSVHHGVEFPTYITDSNEILFKGISSGFNSARYHSWVLRQFDENLDIRITATDNKGEVMGISHKEFNIKGIQFHPESILTRNGFQILKNWVESL